MSEPDKTKSRVKEIVRRLSRERKKEDMDPKPGPSHRAKSKDRGKSPSREKEKEEVRDTDEECSKGSECGKNQAEALFDEEEVISDDYFYTMAHPFGNVLLNMLEDQLKIMSKDQNPEAQTSVKGLCQAFRSFAESQRINEEFVVENAIEKVERRNIERELQHHTVNAQYSLPRYFSPHNVLTTVSLRNNAMKAFPTKDKFSGSKEGPGVLEFLSTLTMAQEAVQCSEDEFFEILLHCTTGRAHLLVMDWITNLGKDVGIIYNQFLLYFDKRTSPQDAKRQLQA